MLCSLLKPRAANVAFHTSRNQHPEYLEDQEWQFDNPPNDLKQHTYDLHLLSFLVVVCSLCGMFTRHAACPLNFLRLLTGHAEAVGYRPQEDSACHARSAFALRPSAWRNAFRPYRTTFTVWQKFFHA